MTTLLHEDVLVIRRGRGWVTKDSTPVSLPSGALSLGQVYALGLIREPWGRYIKRRILVRTWPLRRIYRMLVYGHPWGKKKPDVPISH